MIGEFFKGNVNDVVDELIAESTSCKGMTVGEWLRKRRDREEIDAKKLGISVEEYRKRIRGKEGG